MLLSSSCLSGRLRHHLESCAKCTPIIDRPQSVGGSYRSGPLFLLKRRVFAPTGRVQCYILGSSLNAPSPTSSRTPLWLGYAPPSSAICPWIAITVVFPTTLGTNSQQPTTNNHLTTKPVGPEEDVQEPNGGVGHYLQAALPRLSRWYWPRMLAELVR